MDSNGQQFVGSLTIQFDDKGGYAVQQEGKIPLQTGICAAEMVKIAFAQQLMQHQMQALQRQQSRGILLPDGTLPPPGM